MVTGFNHSGFVVKDIEKMVDFYRDALGLTVMREVNSVDSLVKTRFEEVPAI